MNFFILWLEFEVLFIPLARTFGFADFGIFVYSVIKLQHKFVCFVDEVVVKFEIFR